MASKKLKPTKTKADIRGWKPTMSKREFIFALADETNTDILKIAKKHGIGLSKSYLHKVKSEIISSDRNADNIDLDKCPGNEPAVPMPTSAPIEVSALVWQCERLCLRFGLDAVEQAIGDIKRALSTMDPIQ